VVATWRVNGRFAPQAVIGAESAFGPLQTTQPDRRMSALRVKPEVGNSGLDFGI
jgi:hypothetical protein